MRSPSYLVKVNGTTLPADDAKSIGGLFHVVNDIERIGDHAENIADAAEARLKQNIGFSESAKRELSSMLDMVIKITTYALDMFSSNNQEHMQEILDLEDQVDETERELQESHIQRLTRGECTASAGMMLSGIISGLEEYLTMLPTLLFPFWTTILLSSRKRSVQKPLEDKAVSGNN